ncbi:hypothetical protein [Polaromonas sp. YR568]|uniref:hypothetical protein n=1 Tax=Polaromonas sp. YR568 TaxID=1855301 RepID=UPI00398BE77F
MAASIDALTAQLILTQSFLTRIILTHPEPRALVGELEQATKGGIAVATVATNGANETVKNIQSEARHWHKIIEEQISRATVQQKFVETAPTPPQEWGGR